MRDHRDAKSMAHVLREELASKKNYKLTVAESLELIAHLFGAADWNTLSALIKNAERDQNPPTPPHRAPGPRFAPTLEAVLFRSMRAADERGQTESTVEHLLLSLTEDLDAAAIMKARGVDPNAIREALERSIEIATPGDPRFRAVDPHPSTSFQRAVQRAILDAQAASELTITGAHLLSAILSQDTTAARILRDHGLDAPL